MNPTKYTIMFYTLKTYLRLLIVALVVLFIQLSLSISPVLSQDIKIGIQIWTSKNLDVSTFRNGEVIPEAKSKEEWEKAGKNNQPAWCYYDNNEQNGKVYGKLYNWYAVNDSRGLLPSGYHIPSHADWIILTDFLGGKNIAGEKMKSKQGWKKNGKKSGNGNNSSGFNGLPGGYCDVNGYFFFVHGSRSFGNWWSSSEYADNGVLYWVVNYVSSDLTFYSGNKNDGHSVRCIKD